MPVSTPKTPTLVIVIVPPAMSAGGVRPSRAVAVSAPRASASSTQRQRVGVLDVGYDEPAGRRRRDAQVDVVLDHDLLGRLVPGGVDLRIALHRQQQRLGHHQQRRDLTPANSRSALSRSTSRMVAGHVDGDELGHVRRGERAGHHRLRGHLADALDRHPGLPLAGRRTPDRSGRRSAPPAAGACSVRLCTSSRVTDPCGPVPVIDAQVDAELLGQRAHRRLGQRLGRALGGRPAPAASLRRGSGLGRGLGQRASRPGRRRRGRSRADAADRLGRRRVLARAALGLGDPRPVADQHGGPPARGRTADQAGLDRRPPRARPRPRSRPAPAPAARRPAARPRRTVGRRPR